MRRGRSLQSEAGEGPPGASGVGGRPCSSWSWVRAGAWRQRRLDRPCVEGRVGGHGREARPQCTREAGVGRVPGKPRDLLGVSGGQSSWAQAAIQL